MHARGITPLPSRAPVHYARDPMKTRTTIATLSVLLASALVGCSQDDPRTNSNPHPEGALEKDRPVPGDAPQPAPTQPKAGEDQPTPDADASGGTKR